MKPRFLGFGIAIACTLVTQPIFGQIHQLLLTENSSTSLSVTYDGSSTGIAAAPTGPDQWMVVLPVNISPTVPAVTWFEPGSVTSFNNVNGVVGALSVSSDSPLFDAVPGQDDNPFFFGFDLNDGQPIQVTFDDDGDVATTVPDTGATFGLLLLALTAVFGANRRRGRFEVNERNHRKSISNRWRFASSLG